MPGARRGGSQPHPAAPARARAAKPAPVHTHIHTRLRRWRWGGGAGAASARRRGGAREGGRLHGEAYLVRIDAVLPHLRRQLTRQFLVRLHLTQRVLRRWGGHVRRRPGRRRARAADVAAHVEQLRDGLLQTRLGRSAAARLKDEDEHLLINVGEDGRELSDVLLAGLDRRGRLAMRHLSRTPRGPRNVHVHHLPRRDTFWHVHCKPAAIWRLQLQLTTGTHAGRHENGHKNHARGRGPNRIRHG